jgi:hypothetical protein
LAEATASFGIDAEVRDLLSAPESPVLGVTSSGLPRRRATDPADFSSDSGSVEGAVASQRSPEEIRSLLSSYRGGLDRGRRLPSLGATDEGAPS